MTQDNVEYVTAVIGVLSSMLGVPGSKIYRSLNSAGIIQNYLIRCYDVLHTFSLEYVADDIISIMKRKGLEL